MNGKISSLSICLTIFSLSFHSIDNNRVNSAFYLGMGYMRISLKSPTALSFRYTTIFKCEKEVCVWGGGGGGGGGGYK